MRRFLASTSATLLTVALTALAPGARATDSGDLPVHYTFLTNAVRAGTSASAPGENDWTCRPSAAHPRPVVLVHGTGGNAATNWVTYAALLHNNGYCVYALTYGVVRLRTPHPSRSAASATS